VHARPADMLLCKWDFRQYCSQAIKITSFKRRIKVYSCILSG